MSLDYLDRKYEEMHGFKLLDKCFIEVVFAFLLSESAVCL